MSKATTTLTEQLYNINYTRAGNHFGKFHKEKACCHRVATRFSIKDFTLTSNDRRIYKRFNSFLKGEYILRAERSKEEIKEDSAIKPLPTGLVIRNMLNE